MNWPEDKRPEHFKRRGPTAACKHESCSFDRSVCACGSMHDYCDECGAAMDCPLDNEPQEQSAACRHSTFIVRGKWATCMSCGHRWLDFRLWSSRVR